MIVTAHVICRRYFRLDESNYAEGLHPRISLFEHLALVSLCDYRLCIRGEPKLELVRIAAPPE